MRHATAFNYLLLASLQQRHRLLRGVWATAVPAPPLRRESARAGRAQEMRFWSECEWAMMHLIRQRVDAVCAQVSQLV